MVEKNAREDNRFGGEERRASIQQFSMPQISYEAH